MPVKEKPRTPPSSGFDDHALGVITAAYGMRGVDALLPIILDGTHASMLDIRSETSRKALLEDERGTWFLKQVPWYADDDGALARRHALLADLSAHTAILPRPLSTQDRSGWVRVDGAAFEVTEYRTGRRFTGSTAQVRAAGAALATLHDALIGTDREPAEDYRTLVVDHVRLAHQVTGELGPARLLSTVDTAVAEVLAALPDAAWSRLPRTFTHGDYNPWNLVFGADDAVVAVVDHDNCDVGTRLRDLVEGWLTHAAVAYRGDSTSFATPLRCDPDERRSAAFLSGYLETTRNPLTADERACLPAVVRAVHLELVALAALRGEVGDESAADVARWQAAPPVPPLEVRDAG
ncbi:Ser/Thr protein kinase RdoA involved in Cpx stress response, MazF antagonist [Actinokineospora alba]|uniref:Ser/Thr protein kinase RdoA involved in Cpx stress response, MazF antagonist n=1 Tax=Actinokineospora alba TaxID=504798 RepID=A0A1H0HG90_9PSEU|nr:phosphotransferase [Actinokineospora alba]TDP64907.1 Ser/Thr protein kinase RdoA (MazF antagonist) [Actinokineospora alba]SDH49094.1 Ser/Thr protein kinase RdoA involved in Cpx stress response, MazF antagonist [Actinokineospora alba]SDO17851.1 Ser/Thr protein kinase RdoA involved in Cpx stress response, MazF antagonist [Actinokineospora alba]